MPGSRTDLLSVTRSLLRGALWLDLLFVALATAIQFGLFFGHPQRMTLEWPAAIPPEDRLFAARAGVAAALSACLLLLPLLLLLLRIVDSARAGDPFMPENGARLRRIGGLLLALNIAANFASVAMKGHIGFPRVSATAVLTVLMVFVIARIFDVGSAMRAELKETV